MSTRVARRRAVLVLTVALAAVLPTADATAEVRSGMTRRLGDDADPVLAAVDLSQGAWDDGAARVVALGRDDLFPDSLAGAALAGTNGPVLFTTGGASAALAPAVRAEIERVLPDPAGCDGDGEVAILGGTGAISSAVETELAGLGYCVRRFGGATRVETALLIARRVLATGGDPSRILVSRSDNWPDSATGSAYAAATGHPIVITSPSALDPAVAAFLDETNPGEIVLLGGTGALSPAVQTAAGAYAPTRRVAGASRDATSVAIAEELWADLEPTGVALVNGFAANGWAYAIAAAVNAALDGAAELFVDASTMSQPVRDYLEETDDTFTIIAGPDALVSGDVAASGEATRGMLAVPGEAPLRYRDPVFAAVAATSRDVYGRAVRDNGSEVPLYANVYEPVGDTVTSRPAIIWVHGGYFSIGTPEYDEVFFSEWVRRGYVVISISYRLTTGPFCQSGDVVRCFQAIRDATDDAQAAVRFLRENADDYGIDPTRIAIAGSSAGATTALNVGFSMSEEPDASVRGAVALAGSRQLVTVSPGDAPSLLFHGTADDLVPYEWATWTIDEAEIAGLTTFLRTLPGGGHSISQYASAQVIEETCAFLWWQMDLQGAAR